VAGRAQTLKDVLGNGQAPSALGGGHVVAGDVPDKPPAGAQDAQLHAHLSERQACLRDQFLV
jgi:hypothetical protein